jgi:hypothetical protein
MPQLEIFKARAFEATKESFNLKNLKRRKIYQKIDRGTGSSKNLHKRTPNRMILKQKISSILFETKK